MSTEPANEQQPKVTDAQPLSPLELAATALVESCRIAINAPQRINTDSPIVRGYLEASAARAQLVLQMMYNTRVTLLARDQRER